MVASASTTPVLVPFGSLWIDPAHVVLFSGAVASGAGERVSRPKERFPGLDALTLQAVQLADAELLLSNPASVLLY
ncbi:MAG: hypothetical protein AAF628_20505 [Planctomycetota bacterium]